MEKKVETEKFIINYVYNEKMKLFDKFYYENKNLNNIELQILDHLCLLTKEFKVHELYEHAIITIENNMRDFASIKYSGVLFSENIEKEFKYFRKFIREFLYEFIKDEIGKKINFQYKKPTNNWLFLNEDEKKKQLTDQINNYVSKSKINCEIDLLRIEGKSNIYINIKGDIDSKIKGSICLQLEIFLKKVEQTITVYFEWKTDKNKLRRIIV
jgi:hypothetical protein